MEKIKTRVAEQISVDDLPDAYGPTPAKELVDSVAVYGVIQPLLVMRDEGTGELTILDGNRRLMAARRMKMESVPALVVKQDETQLEEIARLTLQMNNLRSTNDYAEQGAYDAVTDVGGEAEAIAKESGLSRAAITKRARWNVTHRELMLEFYDQKIAPTVIDAVSKLPADLQVEAYERFKNEGKLTTAAVKEIEEAAKGPKPERTPGHIYADAKAQADVAVEEMLSVVKELHGADMRQWIDGIHYKLTDALEERVKAKDEEPVYLTIDDVPF
ncbi:nucleoid occlusion protein-like [Tenebrio molitor]|uniref:nucleoid occlusion protein-like n=1 Tax=Tenebrio molitor TaxID=7067 RepID=UPI0036246DED